MKKRLHVKLFDTKDKTYKQTFLGIPQGGVDSSYLWNIYLLGFDEFIKNHITNKFAEINQKVMTDRKGNTIKNPPINPLYNRADKELIKIKKLVLKEKSKLALQNYITKEEYKPLFELIKTKKS